MKKGEVKYNRFELWLSRHFKRREIPNCERDIYLVRWYLVRTKRLGVFLHKFLRSDEDRCLHDHPWDFAGIILKQGYIEHSERYVDCPLCHSAGQIPSKRYLADPENMAIHSIARYVDCYRCDGSGEVRQAVQTRRFPGDYYRQPAEYRHRVELIKNKPSWTLFFRFTERREWGFWEDGKRFIDNMKWWKEKCE